MESVALLFLAVGVANLEFARRNYTGDGARRAAAPANAAMGVIALVAGGLVALFRDAAVVVIVGAVPLLLIASLLHTRLLARASAADADEDALHPPV